MARYTAKPTTGKSYTRKQKFQKICGWETTDCCDETDIEAWVHIQQQSISRKDKLNTPPEHLGYKHVPKRRCVGLGDCSVFEKNSLHEKFYIKPDENIQKTSATVSRVAIKPAGTVHQGTVSESRSLDSRKQSNEKDGRLSRDDMDVHNQNQEDREKVSEVSSSPKRSRSVPITRALAEYRATKAVNPSHTMRRMLYYARKYEAKDSAIKDEDEDTVEDEGYGSKTPSAEDKDMKPYDSSYLTNTWATDYFKDCNSTVVDAPKLAKFSYTHQGTTKSQLYGDSEDGDTKESVISEQTNYVKYYKNGYMESAKKILLSKNQDRTERTCTASIVNGYDTNNIHGRIEELKPVTMVLRKISIQDSEESNSKSVEETPPEPMYEIHRSFSRAYSTLQSDRAQYPVTCTSPELKFIHGQRPPSRQSSKLKMDIGKNHSDMVANTNFSVLDFHRSRSSVCVPLGELFPAMDRNLKGKHSANSTESTLSLPNTARDQISSDTQSTPRLSSVDDSKMDFYSERKVHTLNSPFRQHSKGNQKSLDNRKLTQPVYLMNAYANPVTRVNKDGVSRIPQTKTKDGNIGMAGPELALSGYRVEINGEIEQLPPPEKPNKLGTLKISKHTDKDTKKKLREAFSRFYNKDTTTFNNRASWSEDCRYTWNT